MSRRARHLTIAVIGGLISGNVTDETIAEYIRLRAPSSVRRRFRMIE